MRIVIVLKIALLGLLFAQLWIAATFNRVQAGDFTFKRLKVSDIVDGNRLNIQITTPKKNTANVKKKPPPSDEINGQPPAVIKGDFSWFWQIVSPNISAANFNRLDFAVQGLQKAPKDAPTLGFSIKDMQKIVNNHGHDILLASINKAVSPAFLLAIIATESSGNSAAVSSSGAVGLMQLIPATAERFNVKDATNPYQNITGGAAYIEWLLREFRHDPLLALAGYNAGENAVKRNNGVPPFPQTRAYVPKVLANWQVARSLCQTVPVFVFDPCVFKDL